MFQSHIYLFQAFVLLGLGGARLYSQQLACRIRVANPAAQQLYKSCQREGIQRADFNRKLAEVSVVHEEETWAGETLVKAIHGYG